MLYFKTNDNKRAVTFLTQHPKIRYQISEHLLWWSITSLHYTMDFSSTQDFVSICIVKIGKTDLANTEYQILVVGILQEDVQIAW